MTIVISIGSAIGSQVILESPLGFGATRAVRVTNTTADIVVLTNILGVGQDQQYLFPSQQMVYYSVNISATPTAQGLTLSAATIAAGLYVEWSTEPHEDFIGTYPTNIAGSSGGGGGGSVTQGTVPWITENDGVSIPVIQVPDDVWEVEAFVSNFPATQPVSGTVAVSGTVPVSAAALPLPAGAATAAKQPTIGVAGTPSADYLSIQGQAVPADGTSGTALLGQAQYMWDGAGWERVRVANVFKRFQTTSSASNATVWTPATGKKFRLIKLIIEFSENVSTAGSNNAAYEMLDGGTLILPSTGIFFIPTAAVTTGYGNQRVVFDYGPNGILSAAANNVLGFTLSSALATGVCTVFTMGTEE